MKKTSFECFQSYIRRYIDLTDAELGKRIRALFPLVASHFEGHRIANDGAGIEPALTEKDQERFALRTVQLMPEVRRNRQQSFDIQQRIYELEQEEMFSGWPGVS